ncbi:AraC family transcriptional regulator, partial [bacterium]|nr:AraC family transcriptional regulator [bacterium]
NYYECVLDVPPGAKAVAFGVLMSGDGKVWFSKVALEQASDDVEVTGTKEDIQARQQPVNMCFQE